MRAIQKLSETYFRETITKAVQDVFQVMLGRAVTLNSIVVPVISETSPPGDSVNIDGPTVVGAVGFVGDITGLLYLYLEEVFADEVAGGMLGMSQAELAEAGSDAVNDAVGELTNMTVGVFKSQLADQGFPCRLTIPSILRGNHFSIEPTTAALRRIYRFHVGVHHVVVDLFLKTGV